MFNFYLLGRKHEAEEALIAVQESIRDRKAELYNLAEELKHKRLAGLAEVKDAVADAWLEARKQKAEAEHEYHSEKEKRGIELAKLEAKIEERKALLGDWSKLYETQGNLTNTIMQVVQAVNKTCSCKEKGE